MAAGCVATEVSPGHSSLNHYRDAHRNHQHPVLSQDLQGTSSLSPPAPPSLSCAGALDTPAVRDERRRDTQSAHATQSTPVNRSRRNHSAVRTATVSVSTARRHKQCVCVCV